MASTAGNRMKAIFEADISDFKKKVEQAEQLMADYVKKMEDSGRALKESKRHTEKLKKQQEKLNNELKRGTTSQDKFNSKNEELNQQIKKSEQLTESLQKEFEELRGDVTSASNAMEEMGHNSKQYAQQSKKTATATSRLDKGMTRFNHSTGAANNVMMSFGQTIQDAPYGIRGVANNITFLSESFGTMVSQTGSAKNAFKALITSMSGITGITLLISVITSALVSFGDELLDTKTAADEARESYKKAREELDKFIESLNSLDNVKLKTSIDIATEQFKVLDLFQRAKGGEEAAFKQLKEDYPAALKGISDSSELNRESLDKLVQSVIELNNKFKNKEAWDQYKSNLEDIVKFQKQINTLTNKLIPQAKKYDKDFQWEFSEWVDDLKGLFGSGNVDKLVDKLEAAKKAVKR